MEHLGANEPKRCPDLDVLIEYTWSMKFEQYMRNRLVIGHMRYGDIKDPKRQRYDQVGSAIKRLKLYLVDGNQEHLVDAANLAMLEFINPCCHSSPSFRAQDDKNHTPVKR
jgi:hypothetical protein